MKGCQQRFQCQVGIQFGGCNVGVIIASAQFSVMGDHDHLGELPRVCDHQLSQTDCHECRNEIFHMPTLLIGPLSLFGYNAALMATDYGLHMPQAL